jgi:ATP-dependent helicase/nuclease subunit A
MDVVRLLESSLGQRMKAADARGKLMREVPFMAGVPVSFIDQGPALVSVHHEDEDLVIIQGVIDACFEEDGRMVIVDYKTDAVSRDEGEAVLTRRYKKQLDYYAFALSKMTHLPADERRIYSTRMQRDFAVS